MVVARSVEGGLGCALPQRASLSFRHALDYHHHYHHHHHLSQLEMSDPVIDNRNGVPAGATAPSGSDESTIVALTGNAQGQGVPALWIIANRPLVAPDGWR